MPVTVIDRPCANPGKIKYATEEEALVAAAEATEELGELFKVHDTCPCGRWHIYNRTKKHRKANQRESRNDRRKRARLGLPSPLQLEQQRVEALRREHRRAKQREKRRRVSVQRQRPLMVWEDEGGALATWLQDD